MNRVEKINEAQADELRRRLPARSKLIFWVAIETGLRISDILRLKFKDVENPIRVYVGRTATVEAFPLSNELYDELLSRMDDNNFDHYIFRSRKWKRHLHRTTYHRDIKQAIAGLDFSASAHSTRKLFLALR